MQSINGQPVFVLLFQLWVSKRFKQNRTLSLAKIPKGFDELLNSIFNTSSDIIDDNNKFFHYLA